MWVRQKLHIRPRGIKLFFILNSTEHEIFSADKYVNANNVGIFICISKEMFMLCLSRKNWLLLVI